MTAADESLVELRCAVAVVRGDAVHPPIAGYLPDFVRPHNGYARYLGNMWRPGAQIR